MAQNLEDIEDKKINALNGLLQSLGSTEYDGQKASPEVVRKLAERLSEMLGDADEGGKGEMVNEAGEPIIEISHPEPQPNLPSESLPQAQAPAQISDDPPALPPLSNLPPAIREQRKQQMENILDLLEAEEADAEEKSEAVVRERIRKEAEKKKREAIDRKRAIDTRNKKEREKKMGKALLAGLGKDEPTRPSAVEEKREKKSVKFIDGPPPSSSATPGKTVTKKNMDMGDVIAALPSTSSRNLFQRSSMPMKSEVVERFPSISSGAEAASASPEAGTQADSDDESVSNIPLGEDSEGGEEFDIEEAMHLREIALEYARRRERVLENASALPQVMEALAVNSTKKEDWDQEHVPLEATMASQPPKPKHSRFKASLAVQSLEGAVLPSSLMKSAVRVGKLEDEQLVAEDSEEEDEDNVENAKRTLLASNHGQEMEIVNTGPAVKPPISNKATPASLRSETLAPSEARTTSAPPIVQSSAPKTAHNPQPSPAMIISSPSFSSPAAAPATSTIQKRQQVMSRTVRESTPRQTQQANVSGDAEESHTGEGRKRVSRFRAERS